MVIMCLIVFIIMVFSIIVVLLVIVRIVVCMRVIRRIIVEIISIMDIKTNICIRRTIIEIGKITGIIY